MMEEEVYVSEVAAGRVWIEKNRKSSCSGCAEACPSSLASGLFGEKRVRLSVRTDLPLSPGDKIVIGVAEDGKRFALDLSVTVSRLFRRGMAR